MLTFTFTLPFIGRIFTILFKQWFRLFVTTLSVSMQQSWLNYYHKTTDCHFNVPYCHTSLNNTEICHHDDGIHWQRTAKRKYKNKYREYRNRKPNILVLGLSSCGHSVMTLLSASVLTSTELPPTYAQHAFIVVNHKNSIWKYKLLG